MAAADGEAGPQWLGISPSWRWAFLVQLLPQTVLGGRAPHPRRYQGDEGQPCGGQGGVRRGNTWAHSHRDAQQHTQSHSNIYHPSTPTHSLIHTCTDTQVHTHRYTHTNSHRCTHTCTHINTQRCTHMCAHKHRCTHTHTDVHTYTHTNTQVHTDAHTPTHT